MLDGLARSYNWIALALMPHSLLRPVVMLRADGAASCGGLSRSTPRPRCWRSPSRSGPRHSFSSCCSTGGSQSDGPTGPERLRCQRWFATALPIFAVWALLHCSDYADVLVLQQFRPPDEVAHYYAAAKTLTLVTFVHFSVSAAVAHRFAALSCRRRPRRACRPRRQAGALDLLAVACRNAADPGVRQADPLAVRAGFHRRPIRVCSSWRSVCWRAPRSGRRSGCSTCWASSASARWSMPRRSRSISRSAWRWSGPLGGIGVAIATSAAIVVDGIDAAFWSPNAGWTCTCSFWRPRRV